MKKIFISLAAFVAVSLALVSCHNNSVFNVTVEEVAGNGAAAITWPNDAVMTTWDDTKTPAEISFASIMADSSYAVMQLPEGMKTQGVRHFVYPASVYAGEGMVMVPAVQSGVDFPNGMPFYAETSEGNTDLAFKALCGVVRLHLTTPEHLASVQVSSEDTNGFMTGRYGVDNHPFPVLASTQGAAKYVSCEQLQNVDFSAGADVNLFVAPGCFNSFAVTMVTEDGRVCVKNLKEGKYVVVERNSVCTINLGGEEGELVFE